MQQPEIIEGALVIAFLILSLGIHEAAHAWVANLCGDSTAKDLGRLTLSPIPHIDPFMTIILPLFLYLSGGMIFGGAKPVPVNPHRLRHPLRDMSFVALAGPISNLILAIIFMVAWKALVYGGLVSRDSLADGVLRMSALYNVLLAVFNMIPIPPLDGSRVMAYVLPASMRESYVRLERFGMLLVVAFVFFIPQTRELLTSALWSAWDLLDTLTGGVWNLG